MPLLPNPRHEAFAQLYAEGMSATQAYKKAISTRCSTASAMQSASRLLVDVKVASRVKELKDQASEIATERLGFSKEALLRYYVEVLETPVSEISEGHRLAQEFCDTEHGKRVKMPSKIEAAKQIASLTGWNEPQEVEVGAKDEVWEFLNRIRKPGLQREPVANQAHITRFQSVPVTSTA